MIKGYIFKDEGSYWTLGFLSNIGVEGESLFTTHGSYTTWDEAVKALIEKQIEGQ